MFPPSGGAVSACSCVASAAAYAVSPPCGVPLMLQDLDMMGKKHEDALDSMEGGASRDGGMNANESRIV